MQQQACVFLPLAALLDNRKCNARHPGIRVHRLSQDLTRGFHSGHVVGLRRGRPITLAYLNIRNDIIAHYTIVH